MTQRRTVLLIALGFSVVALLGGCALIGGEQSASGPSATAMNTSAAESSQSATPKVPTATPTAAPAAFLPVGLSCSVLLPDAFVVEVGPNFGRLDGYTPDAGSTDSFIASNQGVACRLVSLSGGDRIDVAVASMTAAGLAELATDLSSGESEVNDFGPNVRGFFTGAGGVGQANAISDKYWVVVSSPLFAQARDAAPIVAQVLSQLG
jgi:hypothetical protein